MSVALQIAGFVLLAAACLLLVPALLLLLQVLAAILLRDRAPGAMGDSANQRTSLAVLMPAHDEEAVIEAAIHAVLPQLQPQDRLLVVADNCSDATALIARAAGADVIERHDAQRRGKGYALDFGVRALEARPPEVVVVVDADCSVAPGSLRALATHCVRTDRPIQALYLMHSPPEAGLKTRMAELAWVVKNQVRPLGLRKLGLPCQLMGTGMAFPWAVIRSAPLASGHLVEDLQLGLDLAAAGHPPLFCLEARVTSVFPSHEEGLASQRTRWEHGHLSVIAGMAPRLLWRAARRGRLALALMALDLCVPPLASLVLATGAVLVLSVVLLALGGEPSAFAIALAALLAVAAAVMLAWRRFGREIVSFDELLAAPAYALGKLPMYARLLGKRQVQWVRTRRGDKSD